MVYALSQRWAAVKSDVTTAFLQAPLDIGKRVFVKLPMCMPAAQKSEVPIMMGGNVLEALHALYGFKYSPRVFSKWLKGNAA